MTEPTQSEPTMSDRTVSEPAVNRPALSEPAVSQPAVSESEPAGSAAPATGDGKPRSGLRNPVAAVRGLGAAALASEALVLLLAILPIRVLGGANTNDATVLAIVLAVVCVALAGLLKRAWAWWVVVGLQVALLAFGLLHPTFAALGVVFGLLWTYVMYVRRIVLVRTRA